MKNLKLLLILSISLVGLAVGFVIAGSILVMAGKNIIGDIFVGVSGILGAGALILLVYRLSIMAKTPQSFAEPQPKVVKTVDVKEVPKSKEQKLFEQYEDLYKNGLITKEDLDKKREELLKK